MSDFDDNSTRPEPDYSGLGDTGLIGMLVDSRSYSFMVVCLFAVILSCLIWPTPKSTFETTVTLRIKRPTISGKSAQPEQIRNDIRGALNPQTLELARQSVINLNADDRNWIARSDNEQLRKSVRISVQRVAQTSEWAVNLHVYGTGGRNDIQFANSLSGQLVGELAKANMLRGIEQSLAEYRQIVTNWLDLSVARETDAANMAANQVANWRNGVDKAVKLISAAYEDDEQGPPELSGIGQLDRLMKAKEILKSAGDYSEYHPLLVTLQQEIERFGANQVEISGDAGIQNSTSRDVLENQFIQVGARSNNNEEVRQTIDELDLEKLDSLINQIRDMPNHLATAGGDLSGTLDPEKLLATAANTASDFRVKQIRYATNSVQVKTPSNPWRWGVIGIFAVGFGLVVSGSYNPVLRHRRFRDRQQISHELGVDVVTQVAVAMPIDSRDRHSSITQHLPEYAAMWAVRVAELAIVMIGAWYVITTFANPV